MAKKNDPTKVITGPNTLWSYVSVFEPKSINGGDPKYSIQLRIPESDTTTLKKITDAMRAAYEEGSAKLKGSSKTVPPYETLKKALRNGSEEFPDDETMKGYMFLNANNTIKPGIVDANLQPIIDRSEVYSGCFGRASINFFVYNNNGNRGIGCSILNLQKMKDGPVLGGHSRAEDDFADLDDEEDFLG